LTKRASLIFACISRLDQKMAIGVSRHQAKKESGLPWGHSTGRIHSYATRKAYQAYVLRFANWARNTYQIRRIDELDRRAPELVRQWVAARIAGGYSAWTVKAELAALRLFFSNWELAAGMRLPVNHREDIRRSRRPAARDAGLDAAAHAALIAFERATGLRRRELSQLRVGQVRQVGGYVYIAGVKGKGGRVRDVLVLPGREEDVLSCVRGRGAHEKVFRRLPSHLDVHALRREYAQLMYLYLSGRRLPGQAGRLRRGSYDLDAVLNVSRLLGHSRRDVILRHYVR